MEATLDLRNDVELATSVSDKHRELVKPSAGKFLEVFIVYEIDYVNIPET
jgi:hypothetical protein